MLDIKLAISYPTLGKTTMPHFSEVPNLPMTGPAPSDSQTLGGILLLFGIDKSWIIISAPIAYFKSNRRN